MSPYIRTRGEDETRIPTEHLVETARRLWARVIETPSGCWEWQGYIMPEGYGQIGIPKKNGVITTHRAAWEVTNGAIPDGMFVCHKCDNRRCCRPAHLFLGTHADNMRDMDEKGRRRTLRGEERPAVKLSEAAVRDIKARHIRGIHPARRTGASTLELATEYGICKQYVQDIVKGKWRRVK